ncbi:MAG: ATP-binding protein [Chitinophagaceae bacterium]|nr:ATP-binding protein [Chitinophagaceae bacterium]
MVPRLLQSIIEKRIGKHKAILLLGPRQVGKTTLIKQLTNSLQEKILWLNGDDADIRNSLQEVNSTRIKTLIGNNTMIIIDEAQRIPDIGVTIKIIVDNIPQVQVIATGSSSLELAGQIKEPLTGRKYEYHLYPFSFAEMVEYTSLLEEKRLLEHRLIFGYYPEIVINPGEEREHLQLLTDSYLYKDLFTLEQIKKPQLLEKLVQALALQLGNEVIYHELAQIVGADKETIERYIDLLEKAFVIFRIPSLSRNLRNEIKKGRKIYFWDNGIRNAIIKNFNQLSLRQDTGALWENFIVSERQKANHYNSHFVNKYFWRTHAQQEIDYVEESNGRLAAWEFKWNPKAKGKIPATFLEAYPDTQTGIITPQNMEEWLLRLA